jgi:hypothetical protein
VLTPEEARLLQETLSADQKNGSIRLREGEYPYSLAKAIASFQLELHFPDVKDIVKRLYGEEKANDLQFVRKIQTILKKMEKSNIVRILPKRKPWDLQRYALSSFKLLDADRNLRVFATEQEIRQAQDMLRSMSVQEQTSKAKLSGIKVKVSILALVIGASYSASVWALVQSFVNAIIFVPAFSIAVMCSLVLGRILSQG